MPKTAGLSRAADASLPDPSRWKALAFIALAQLMVVLDATIVNIALPSAQTDLGISDGNKQWVITAYALAFGGLLLFGGRIADLWGRKRTFVVGLIGFALASALGGAAQNEAMMFGSRALQGVFGALLAPAALSLLAVMFTDAKERAKAFGIYGAIAGGGGAVGLILGGFLTEYLNWRWTFFVNIPFAIVAAAGAYFVIREPSGARNRAPLDIPGVVLSTLGLVALVYGFTRAESSKLVGRADRLHVHRRRRAAAGLRGHRGAREVAAAAAARPHRAQPWRGLPLAGSRHHRDVRAVPLPDLLPPGREGLLPGQDRLRVHADDRGHDHRLHPDRHPADDPGPAASADGPRIPGRRGRHAAADPAGPEHQLRGRDPARHAAARPRYGYGVHAGDVPGHARHRAA